MNGSRSQALEACKGSCSVLEEVVMSRITVRYCVF